jgi:cell division protein FtsI (penicillin-binding protein 3)
MRPSEKKNFKLRSRLVGALFLLVFLTIGIKAVYLQTFRGTWLSKKAANQYEKSFVSHGKRGIIYDSKKRVLAQSIDVTSVAAYPAKVKAPQQAAKSLAKVLRLNRRGLKRKLASKKSFVWIKRQVSPKEVKAIKALSLAGIDFIPEHNRFYPNRTLAAQVIGFSGIDGNGLEGIEFYYDTHLKGLKDDFTVFMDGLGNGFAADQSLTANHSGNDITLTIDRTIQFIAETTLEETVRRFSAKSGLAIIMAPHTGAVLALAHYPFFNPNSFNDYSQQLWRNRIITDPFEPGSTMKIFSAAAAIESKKCRPDTIFYCENGAYKIGSDVIHDVKPYGKLSLHQIIKYSSNIGAVKLGERLGPRYLYSMLRNFGFGKKSGIDCPGETAGSLTHFKRWSKIDFGAISFGQGISVSAMQLVTAVSAIANDGTLMKPYIVKSIISPKGKTIKQFGPRRIRRVVSAETAFAVKKMMLAVVNGGTGKKASLDGYAVCGKTGTAQKIDGTGTYDPDKFTASFIGFAPAGNPQISVLVVIDEPAKNHYGGVVAAPAFKTIARETLGYLNIPPDSKTDRLMARQDNGA